ncbi:uncharacterized protein SCHCODRAFT_02627977 [Schizophyllum commune H4-8]|uniref:uncharacterized protein n=1 Tax=Schizophyllum commune (strain H4-8 / FGSC 9210) TaxID=578458 RepID=UPI00215DDF15|nr:uncharacterized protein SCHCODRAFT_02627977 [Schizophyllum commune H4-8]KAI5891042.1 hypothetical protein SCHCODRAFT_02627977 [Schizophyllum commune H4-8]
MPEPLTLYAFLFKTCALFALADDGLNGWLVLLQTSISTAGWESSESRTIYSFVALLLAMSVVRLLLCVCHTAICRTTISFVQCHAPQPAFPHPSCVRASKLSFFLPLPSVAILQLFQHLRVLLPTFVTDDLSSSQSDRGRGDVEH